MRFAAPLATLALLGAPAAALGQANPFNPLPQGQTVPTEVVVAPPSNNSDSGGLATWQQVLIFGAGLVLLLGIGWAIASDARRRAPVKDSELAHPGLGGPVKRNRSLKQKERDRAKAKRGRRAKAPPDGERDVIDRNGPPCGWRDSKGECRRKSYELSGSDKPLRADVRDKTCGVGEACRYEGEWHERHACDLRDGHERNGEKVERQAGKR